MTPGSPEAIAAGCTCPRMDNANGAGSGYRAADGSPLFWIDETCPIHGTTQANTSGDGE